MAQTGFPSRSAYAEVYAVDVSTTSTVICNLNPTKDGWIILNAGTSPIYIKYGDDCNPVVYTFLLKPKGILSDNYGGVITGCVDLFRETGLLLVTLKL